MKAPLLALVLATACSSPDAEPNAAMGVSSKDRLVLVYGPNAGGLAWQ